MDDDHLPTSGPRRFDLHDACGTSWVRCCPRRAHPRARLDTRRVTRMRGSGLIWTIVGVLLIIALLIFIF
ncbi:hypothetical protein [Serinicoccus chungangensis]|uniref:hypothetical protein n=1 Tax=Serinicoccus chungangensis TaxID=767452 RepID=UPI00128F6A5E|nr:hypothetical protein [Serinicoccus chungangensis]